MQITEDAHVTRNRSTKKSPPYIARPQFIENFNKLLDQLSQWHPQIRPLRDQLRAAVKKIPIMKREAEQRERNAKRGVYEVSGWEWHAFLREGQILAATRKSAPMKVSAGTLERALAIVNTLALQAQRRGVQVTVNNDCGRFQFTVYDTTVDVRIAEHLDKPRPTEPRRWDAPPDIKPTGMLRVFVRSNWSSEMVVADEAGSPLEENLNGILVRIYRAAVRQRQRDREQAERERAWQAEQREREGIAELARQAEAQTKAERQRRRTLIAEAQRWKTATLIREYVAHVAAADARRDLSDEKRGWAIWASLVADALDPSVEGSGDFQRAAFLPRGNSPKDQGDETDDLY